MEFITMFKNLLVNWIKTKAGEFLDDINENNLNYSMIYGTVELKDVVLKPNAVTDFLSIQLGKEQAFEVKAGRLDYIQLSIPWANIFGGSEMRLEIDGLYILLGSVESYSKKRVEEIEQKLKQALLRALDPSVIQKVITEAKKHPSLLKKMFKNIFNNLKIKVRNVHVRYEDTVTNPGKPFAAGITLEELCMCTTDPKWDEIKVDALAKVIYKHGQISRFFLYWNPWVSSSDLVGGTDRVSSGKWKSLLKQSIRSKTISTVKFTPVLEPYSAEAKVIYNNDYNYDRPKIDVSFSVKTAKARMSRSQYLSIMHWLEYSKWYDIKRPYREFRPTTHFSSNVRAWFRYAIISVLELNVRPYTWRRIKEYTLKRREVYEKYWTLYKKYLMSEEDINIKQQLEELEKSMDVPIILSARKHAKNKCERKTHRISKDKREKIRNEDMRKRTNSGWLNNFKGFYLGGSKQEKTSVDNQEILYQRCEEAEHLQNMPKGYVAHRIQLKVETSMGSLVMYECLGSPRILNVKMNQMEIYYENRPGVEGMRVLSKMRRLKIYGISTDNKPVKLFTSYGGNFNLTGQTFTVEYDALLAAPGEERTIIPLEIVYDQHAIAEIINFFQSSDGTEDTDIPTLALEYLWRVLDYSRNKVAESIKKRSRNGSHD